MPPIESDQEVRRCAIYTRRSVEQPMAHQFSSVAAQRMICSSYIACQQPKGWMEISKHYDDEGWSGGNLRRPALQELLIDMESGQIDVVVIYKLDRITRTLLDFVRLMDLFEQYGVSFVAVTQNFDTSDSTGRLILNVLLTFAQFEREIYSDRMRDRFNAMSQAGLFVGGLPAFGYDIVDKKLVINDAEASVIRWMFARYLEVQNFKKLAEELAAKRVVRRDYTSKRGNLARGGPIHHSTVRNMLTNPLYVGEIRRNGKCYPGMHEGIVSRDLWDQVQASRAKRGRAMIMPVKYRTDLLRDLIYDGYGRKMGVIRERRYREVKRYYISNQSEWARRHGIRRYRTRADQIEQLVRAAITSFLADRERIRAILLKLDIIGPERDRLAAAGSRASKLLQSASAKQVQWALKALIERIEMSSTLVTILVRTPEIPRFLRWDGVALFRGDVESWIRPHQTELIEVPANTICTTRELTLLLKRRAIDHSNKPNFRLVRLLRKARAAQTVLDDRSVWNVVELARKLGIGPKNFTRLVRLNYLAPDIIAAILDGTQPDELSCQSLMAVDLPMDWSLQRRLLGFPDQPDFLRNAPGW